MLQFYLVANSVEKLLGAKTLVTFEAVNTSHSSQYCSIGGCYQELIIAISVIIITISAIIAAISAVIAARSAIFL